MPKKQKQKSNLLKRVLRIDFRVFLLLLFFAAVFLRSYNLGNTLFFGPEQGVDFFRIKSIVVDHRPVLVGAKTDVAGIFHGPIYYYLASLPFLVSQGDPVFIAYFLIVLNSLAVFAIFQVVRSMFSARAGIIAAVLLTVSFGAISYTHWLSSHPFVIPLSALFLLAIYEFIMGGKKYLILAALSYSLLGQAEFLNYLLYGGIVLVLMVFFFKDFKRVPLKITFLSILIIIVFGFLHYGLFELRNQFIMTKSVLALVSGKGYYISYVMEARSLYRMFAETLSYNILPFLPASISFIIFVTGLGALLGSSLNIQKKLLFVFILTPIILLFFLRHEVLIQFFVYSIVPVCIVLAFLCDRLISRNVFIGVIFCLVILFTQLSAWSLYITAGRFMFFNANQPHVNIRDEKSIIDRIYGLQAGKDFSFQSYTIPYWYQQGWQYLFWQYGKQKYGYLPVEQNGKVLYVIIQDDPSNPNFQNDWMKNTVSRWGTYKDSFKVGVFTVRRLTVP